MGVRARVAAVLVVVCAAACQRKPAAGVRIDPALVTLVPPETVLLVGTRLEALQKTPVYQKYFAARRFPALDEFIERTGLDPRKDLWELLFVSNGKDGVLMGRGKFPTGAMEPKLERAGAVRFGYKGFPLVGNEQAALLLWSPAVTMMGPTRALRALIEQRQNLSGPPPALAALVREVPAESQFWAAYAGGSIRLPFDERSNLGNVNRLLASIRSGTFAADLRSGFDVVATGTCATDDDARQIHDALRGLVGIGRLSTPDNQPELLRVYDSIQVSRAERNVKVDIRVPQDLAEKFVTAWAGK